MVPEIGTLISRCFYDGDLESEPRVRDLLLKPVFATPVVWLTTSHLSAHGETETDLSYSNQSEVRVIRRMLDAVQGNAAPVGKRYSVAVLSGYLSQVSLLRRELSARFDHWSSLDLNINTVDAFQGREADIAIYSVTRSNAQGNIGFLRDLRRLNVALPRGREYLIIVGDHVFAKAVQGFNPFRLVVEHIEAHRLECTVRQGSL
jgi:superfamily I DNA and/or RNA helicase